MKMINVKIHSFVDIITNSSTVIYTYQDSSIGPLLELIEEILRLSGSNYEVDDIFYYHALYQMDILIDLYYDNIDPEYNDDYNKINSYIKDCIINNNIQDWMIPNDSYDYNGLRKPIELYLIPKDPKYKVLVNKLLKFLNSPNIDACHEG